jgi:hypothetical protein
LVAVVPALAVFDATIVKLLGYVPQSSICEGKMSRLWRS